MQSTPRIAASRNRVNPCAHSRPVHDVQVRPAEALRQAGDDGAAAGCAPVTAGGSRPGQPSKSRSANSSTAAKPGCFPGAAGAQMPGCPAPASHQPPDIILIMPALRTPPAETAATTDGALFTTQAAHPCRLGGAGRRFVRRYRSTLSSLGLSSSLSTRRPRPFGCAGPAPRWLSWMVNPPRGYGR